MEEDEGTGRVATNPIKLIRAPKTPRKPDPRISRCKHPENHTSNFFWEKLNCNWWVSNVEIISHCLICVSLVVACSALVVSHPHCKNRCSGGSHLKILIQAHCPLMFPPEHFPFTMYWEADGVYHGFSLLRWWYTMGFARYAGWHGWQIG